MADKYINPCLNTARCIEATFRGYEYIYPPLHRNSIRSSRFNCSNIRQFDSSRRVSKLKKNPLYISILLERKKSQKLSRVTLSGGSKWFEILQWRIKMFILFIWISLTHRIGRGKLFITVKRQLKLTNKVKLNTRQGERASNWRV